MENNIKAILFDIGGTLVCKQNHGYRNFEVIDRMSKFLGLSLPAGEMVSKISRGENEYRTWRNKTLVELSAAERWSRYYLPEFPKEWISKNAETLQNMWSESQGKKWIAPETISTIKELSRRGYLLCTVSHTSPKYLEEAGLSGFFTSRLHAAAFGSRKPHPSIFIAAANDCGVSPGECAFIGDRPSRDVVGSREAGIAQVVLLQNSTTTIEVEPCPMKADVVISDISELLDLFPDRTIHPIEENRSPHFPLLYDASLSTMWWDQARDSSDTFFENGRALGFARFELNHQIPPAEFDSLNLSKYHIGTLHDPCPAEIPFKKQEQQDFVVSSQIENNRRKGVDIAKHTIEKAHQLGARSVVIHPGHITGDHSLDNDLRKLFREGRKGTPQYEAMRSAAIKDRAERSQPFLESTLKSLHEIVRFSQGSAVSLAFENRFHFYELPDFDEMEAILREFAQPWVGWQFDVGHLQVHDALGLMSVKSWLEKFSHRIIGVHFHDVQGIVDHRVPGSGDVDFRMIASYIPTHAQSTLEIDKSFSCAEMSAGLAVLERDHCIARL